MQRPPGSRMDGEVSRTLPPPEGLIRPACSCAAVPNASKRTTTQSKHTLPPPEGPIRASISPGSQEPEMSYSTCINIIIYRHTLSLSPAKHR